MLSEGEVAKDPCAHPLEYKSDEFVSKPIISYPPAKPIPIEYRGPGIDKQARSELQNEIPSRSAGSLSAHCAILNSFSI